MCSVLFLDIVAYSKKSVSAQIAQKELFNSMLANAIRDVPVNDRVILDTGDGAAVTFLGDVEDALKAVLCFRESLLSEGADMDPPLQVCMGINLGPVRLVKDINGQPNIVGDGINVAQRIMGFAKPGQILVSRSYFDAASRLSQEYAGMFYSEGTRTDKHVREHEVYAIGKPGDAAANQKVGEDTLGRAVKQSSVHVAEDWLRNTLSIFQEKWWGTAIATFQNASTQQRALYAGIAGSALILLIVLTVKIVHHPEAQPTQDEVELQAASSVSPATATLQETTASGVNSAELTPTELTMAESIATKNKKTSSASHEKTGKKQDEPPKNPEPKAVTMASMSIAVAPWGEVYLDGNKQGVSPPLDTLQVSPGVHKIEIRNTTFPPYTLSIEVQSDEHVKIRHKFGH